MPNAMLKIDDLGEKGYADCLELQRNLFSNLISQKRAGEEEEEHILLVEHNSVITMGKHALDGNVLFSGEMLAQKGIQLFHIERGGDVTYHGPGQLVVYPIIDLERYRLGVKAYVDLLEESVIRLIALYGIKGERVEGATGVWIEPKSPKARKICAIGVKCSRFCTMHGLALNINTDLSGFSLINPCGFTDKGVTSIAKEIGQTVDFSNVKQQFTRIFLNLLEKDS